MKLTLLQFRKFRAQKSLFKRMKTFRKMPTVLGVVSRLLCFSMFALSVAVAKVVPRPVLEAPADWDAAPASSVAAMDAKLDQSSRYKDFRPRALAIPSEIRLNIGMSTKMVAEALNLKIGETVPGINLEGEAQSEPLNLTDLEKMSESLLASSLR